MFLTTFRVYKKKSKFQLLNWNLDFKCWNLSNEIGIWILNFGISRSVIQEILLRRLRHHHF
jgi:hypothetical protein